MKSNFIKELLNEVKIYKEDVQEDTLEEIFGKNNLFLQHLKDKLE
jgi:hypothetical protein